MPTSVPLTTKNPGDVLTSSLWNTQLKSNIDKLLATSHRTLTVAQFAALTGLEGTKGVVAGDEVYLEVDATNGILWHIVYESTETTYKWRYLGGPPLESYVDTQEGTGSTTYVDLATVGPSVTWPRTGDIDIELEAEIDGTNGAQHKTAVKFGAAATADADAAFEMIDGTFHGTSRSRRYTAVAAATTLKLQYLSNTVGTARWRKRRLRVTPTRLV